MCPRIRLGSFTDSLGMYRDADKSLARPRRKQANVSVRMAWISFGALLCRKKNLMTARVSMLLKSRASMTCFRACFLPVRAKGLSAPRIGGMASWTVVRIQIPFVLSLVNLYHLPNYRTTYWAKEMNDSDIRNFSSNYSLFTYVFRNLWTSAETNTSSQNIRYRARP